MNFMKTNRFLRGAALLLLLCTAVLSLASCIKTRPVMLDLPADDGGVGREPVSAETADTSAPDAPAETSGTTTAATTAVTPAVTTAVTTAATTAVTTAATTAAPRPPVPDDGEFTICLDPGHGFGDGGTDSEYLGDLMEKDITLAVVELLKAKLEALGYNVILTHDGKTFPKSAEDDGNDLFRPQERISYVSDLDIEFYLSMHCDSYPADSSVKGTRLYYSAGTVHTKESGAVAKAMMDGINGALPNSKKSLLREMEHDAAYYVLRACPVPSVLIEMGFVSNKTDAQNMVSEAWRETFAQGIVDGLHKYFAQ